MLGKLMNKLNERIKKRSTEKRAFIKIKPRIDGKFIPTKENNDAISPKMFLQKYGIPEKGIHCVNCNFSYFQEKMAAVGKHIQNNEATKYKKGKKGCEFIALL